MHNEQNDFPTKLVIQEGNVTLTLEHIGCNDLNLSEMLSMFERILLADTYRFEGSLDFVNDKN